MLDSGCVSPKNSKRFLLSKGIKMKSITGVIGIFLIVIGILGLGYQGITYTKREKVAQLGDLQLTADTEKQVHFPPLASGASIVAGLILVVVSRMNRKL